MDKAMVIECSREADHHSGPLRKIDGKYVCQECWARENNIELKRNPGRQTVCPVCGEVLMTRHKRGGISVGNINLERDKAILKCECGYERVIKNPFSQRQNRDEAAFARLRRKEGKEGFRALSKAVQGGL